MIGRIEFAIRSIARTVVLAAYIGTLGLFTLTDFPTRVLGKFNWIETLYAIVLALAFVLAPFFFYPLSTRLWRSRILTLLPVYVGFILLFITALWTWPEHQSAGATLIAGILATLGWVVTQRNARAFGKKQHTINVLLQQRSNEMLRYHSVNSASKFPLGVNLKPSDLKPLSDERRYWKYEGGPNDKSKYPVLASIVWLANYYEFIAMGVLCGDLDEYMMRETLRTIICSYYVKIHEHVKDSQERDQDGVMHQKTYSNLTLLFAEWATPSEKAKVGEVVAPRHVPIPVERTIFGYTVAVTASKKSK